jgi:hypothetical protein
MARRNGEPMDYSKGRVRNPESKEPAKELSKRTPEVSDRRWWDFKGRQCAESISDNVAFLQKNQGARLRQMVISSRLYGNRRLSGALGGQGTRLVQAPTAIKDRITYNAIQSIVDTLTSTIGETKPRPYYLTSGGDYRQQRKAKKLSQFTDGVFYETKTYRLAPKVFRDALIWGAGFVHAFVRGGKIHHERVMPSEIWVDEVEAQYGFPRNLNRVKLVDRDELCGAFPEHRSAILNATRATDTNGAAGMNIADMVTVVESWHLGALGEDGKLHGGKHAIALASSSDGVMLLEPEDWEHDFFPFAMISWCESTDGFWPQGLCEQLQGEQLELNKELWFVQRSMHLASGFKWLLKNGSKVVKEEINNEVGAIINWAGDTAPQLIVPSPIDPVYFENINRIIERMYRKAGVSELSAGNLKPAGLDSKPALREYKDTQADRHKTAGESYDDFFLTLANIDRILAKGLKNYTVRSPAKGSFKQIDFSDIGEVVDEEFVLQCFPVSQLPRDPAGRMQTVQEWVQAGWITPRQARRAMDFPDLDTIESLANAQEDLITKILDAIVDDGEYEPPEPTDDLAFAKETVIEYIQRYRALDLEPEKLEMLRIWNQQVDELMAQAMPPPDPMAAAGVPQGTPPPPPQSQLMPQAA